MRLIAFSIEGYRRFAVKTSVKLFGDLIAFVGPNEAGKSSLLRAIAHLNRPGPFEPDEHTRRTGLDPKLTWHFQLDEDDRAALANIPDTEQIQRAVISKLADGRQAWAFEPRGPRRDRTRRHEAADLLDAHREDSALQIASDEGVLEFNLGDFDKVRETLRADVEDYEASNLDGLRDVARRLQEVPYSQPPTEDDDDVSDGEAQQTAISETMATMLEEVAEQESAPRPWRLCVDALKPRIPPIELFEDEDRRLGSQYELTEVADTPPRALDHLASLAGLSLKALRDEAVSQAVADVATRRNAANRRLLEAFDQSWNQQGIAVQIDVQGTILHIQATTPEDQGLSDIGERSDGMRWFAALLAFSHGWREAPILLVDEIETHLHYDAQADLIGVLSKQRFTSKVIYTTHSFGSLPNDLGTGIRVVQPLDAATSRLENGFWRHGAGFSPLLASMGAAAMSFTPTRHALIGEGAADAILLPTLLRQANNEERLSFQIAPGLSSVAAMAIPDLEVEAGRIGFIVDGDPGGKEIIVKLVGAGVSQDRIVVLEDKNAGTQYEIEDFVAPEVYARAVNEELRCWNELVSECRASDFGDSLRTKALRQWCERHGYAAPDKTAVAQRVVDIASERDVFAPMQRERLQDVLERVRTILHLP